VTALAALGELAALYSMLPEPHRGHADVLLAGLISEETTRAEKKAARLQKLVASHRIPEGTRTSELATVLEFTLAHPRLSAAKVRARLATKMPPARCREYQAILRHIKPKAADAQARTNQAEQTLRDRLAESRSLTPRGPVRQGRALRPRDYYNGKRAD